MAGRGSAQVTAQARGGGDLVATRPAVAGPSSCTFVACAADGGAGAPGGGGARPHDRGRRARRPRRRPLSALGFALHVVSTSAATERGVVQVGVPGADDDDHRRSASPGRRGAARPRRSPAAAIASARDDWTAGAGLAVTGCLVVEPYLWATGGISPHRRRHTEQIAARPAPWARRAASPYLY